MTSERLDLVVIGGGPGGYVAAIRAAQLGLRCALVERERLGGVCLNWGCIPTKALLRSAEVYREFRRAGEFGLSADNIGFDLEAIVARSRAAAARLENGVRGLLRKNKVTVHSGAARLAGPGKVDVRVAGGASTRLDAANIVLATGARPRPLPGFPADPGRIWTYREALVPPRLPKSLLVIGAGAIGLEFATFYRTFGTEVTVVEIEDRVLPVEDDEISAFVRAAMEKNGVTIRTGARVDAIGPAGDGLRATIGGIEHRFERAIVAAGIAGKVEELALESTRVRVERGHVVIDAAGRTDEPGVWAIGDVAGPPWLAHKASHEGVRVAEAIAGHVSRHSLDPMSIPACTFCEPPVASIGFTERAARAAGRKVRIGKFPFAGNGKAIALGATDGLVKTILDAVTGEVLGVHMVGPEVTELIHNASLAKTMEATDDELIETVFPHPTLSETLHESVLAAAGRAIHV
jgi:dihydrolipoamide dehydrogenase